MNENVQFQRAAAAICHQTSEPVSLSKNAWHSLLSDALRERCLETLLVIAERLSDPSYVSKVVEQARKQSHEFLWNEATLVSGFGSLALFYLYLSRSLPEQRWESLAHMYLRLTAQATQQTPLSFPGLFSGSSGFALLLSTFYNEEPRYKQTFDRTCASVVEQIVNFLVLKKQEASTLSNGDYETIAGASGMLAFLTSLPAPTTMMQDTIQKLLAYLVWICSDDAHGRPHWFTPPEHVSTYKGYREQFPNGYFNLGLSHGIPGPLAAFSLAWRAGYRVTGQQAAMEYIGHWIIQHRISDQWGINWPSGIPLEASHSPQQWQHLEPTRNAWCYGSPGIAVSLWLAGETLKNETWQHIAIEGLETVLKRPVAKRGIDSPTICHGIGGLLAICLRFAQSAHSQVIQDHLSQLVTQMLDACSPDFLVGVRDEARPGKFVDDPGFLTGAAGVALVLLAAATPIEPQWDRILLLS